MFPLGTVLFPHMLLPLHVFEPRYRAMMADALADGREFGVVLISRGHEVGGGDLRTDVGTVARILQTQDLDDERSFVIAVGTRRVRVERWLPDDPYPRAEVVDLAEDHDDDRVLASARDLAPRLRRVLALQAELGRDNVDATFELASEGEVACWQAAVLSPLTAYDAQRVLATDDCVTRMQLVEELLTGLEETLQFQLHADD